MLVLHPVLLRRWAEVCGFCHWQSRHDGAQWHVGANAVGSVKISPQNKDLSDTWPEWFEGNNNDFTAYASACNGELVVADRLAAVFSQADITARFQVRDEFVKQKTAENSTAIGRLELTGEAFSIGYYDMAARQILWSQNETRRLPNPLALNALARHGGSTSVGCAWCVPARRAPPSRR